MSAGQKNWFVYIVRGANESLYTGISTDIARRLKEHKEGKKGAKFFRTTAPKELLYTETFSSRSDAQKREYAIKQLTRAAKLKLISKKQN